MSKVFLIDVSKCNGCYNCQFACKDEHCGNDWTPYAKPQPDIGQFWMKLTEHVQGTIPKVKIHYVPHLCNHCDEPACIPVCPVEAIYKRDDGLVIIDPEKCIGCGACSDACPYDAIYRNDELGICQKCTGCAHLLDNGYKLPRCVESCPTDALRFGEKEDLLEELKGAEVRDPASGLGPNVYYKNIPGEFIAGTVYDPVEKEVIIGAKCRAVSGSKLIETVTDEFGDFWFRDLAVGKWDVMITAEGFEAKTFKDVDTEKSVNLGDIPMDRAK
jgi:Fe-S-cluster-containing dehydrogenase component